MADPGKGRARWPLFAIVLVYLGLPIVAVSLYSLATSLTSGILPDGYTLHWWADMFTDSRLLAALQRSRLVAALACVLVAVIVLRHLYWSYVRNPKLRTVVSLIALLPFSLPFVVMAFGIRDVIGAMPGLAEFSTSWYVVVLGHVALCFPFFLWPVDAAMASADIKRLHEASAASGANSWTTLLRVVLPNVRTGVLTGAMLVFAVSFGEYAIAKIVTRSSYETVPIWQVALTPINSEGNPNGVAVMSVVTFLLFLLVSLIVARAQRKGATVAAVPLAVQHKERP